MFVNAIDRFWVARGVNAEELTAVKGRSFAYVGMIVMLGASAALTCGIVNNVVGIVA